jgi:CRISPR type III-associated protein (TIGR04423 family)
MHRQINITEIPKDIAYEGYLWLSDSTTPIVVTKHITSPVIANEVKQSHNDIPVIANEVKQSHKQEIASCLAMTNDNSNPFIVEGHLYAPKEQLSYSIRYTDGRHIVIEYDLNKDVPKDIDEKSFIAHRLPGVSKLKFHQYWKEQKDALCEGMTTLVPADYVFVGFEDLRI